MSQSTDDTPIYTDVEKGRPQLIERMITPGGHPIDYSQPGFPVQHRKFGNPTPCGLISFGLGFFLTALYTLNVRGIQNTRLLMPVLMLNGGIVQSLCGWWEMFLGNTFAATIFISYGSWNFCFVAMFLPAFGVLESYTLSDGTISPEFNQAMGIYMFAWMIISFMFVLAALRSSVGLLSTLVAVMFTFMCLGTFYVSGHDGARIAGCVMCLIACCCGWYSALVGYWTPDTTYSWVHLPPLSLAPA